ncbi:hypothetical protein Trydic_g20988 [Trypoxylus dichotomus]
MHERVFSISFEANFSTATRSKFKLFRTSKINAATTAVCSHQRNGQKSRTWSNRGIAERNHITYSYCREWLEKAQKGGCWGGCGGGGGIADLGVNYLQVRFGGNAMVKSKDRPGLKHVYLEKCSEILQK